MGLRPLQGNNAQMDTVKAIGIESSEHIQRKKMYTTGVVSPDLGFPLGA